MELIFSTNHTFKFIKQHHKKISHVALVSDSPVGTFAEHIAGHFVSAEVKSFSFSELEESMKWISGNNDRRIAKQGKSSGR